MKGFSQPLLLHKSHAPFDATFKKAVTKYTPKALLFMRVIDDVGNQRAAVRPQAMSALNNTPTSCSAASGKRGVSCLLWRAQLQLHLQLRAGQESENWLSKDALGKQPQIILPVRRVVGISVHVPNMRNVLFLAIDMNALADTNQPIFAAA